MHTSATTKLSLTLFFVLTPLALDVAAAEATPVAEVRVDFNTQGITASEARGLAHVASGRTVTIEDPVRIASISKLVLALGVMRLVEQGQLQLDQDVSDYLGWSLRHPEYPDTPITLELLLSHRSGLTDDAGYVADPHTRLREQLGRPKAWNMTQAPGLYFRYTNLNFPVIAAIMERVTGERFDRLMQRLIFEPLAIDACFNWDTCSDAAIARAVTVYRANGEVGVDDLQGRRPACPVFAASDGSCDLDLWQAGENGGLFSPQGGLRISLANLAKIGRLLLNQGELDGQLLLQASSIEEIFDPRWVFDGQNGLTYESDVSDPGGAFFCRYGLATQTLATDDSRCADEPFGDGRPRAGHGGDAYGLVSGLWMDREAGTGVAYFITGADLSQKGENSAFYATEERLLRSAIPAPDLP